jgi:hypothetical protein
MAQLVEEARRLRNTLTDRHNACFVEGDPLPGTAERRLRLRRVLRHARERLVRRLVRASRPTILERCGQPVEIPAPIVEMREPIHEWFELTYAQYLTIPRSVLQSMDMAWQARFVACLDELDEAIDWRPAEGRYWVQLRDAQGRIRRDPLQDYERGRRRIAHRSEVRDGPAD